MDGHRKTGYGTLVSSARFFPKSDPSFDGYQSIRICRRLLRVIDFAHLFLLWTQPDHRKRRSTESSLLSNLIHRMPQYTKKRSLNELFLYNTTLYGNI